MTTAQETIILRGHIIDSLILAKVLDLILTMGGSFDLEHVEIGRTREDQSRVRILVHAPSTAILNHILHGSCPVRRHEKTPFSRLILFQMQAVLVKAHHHASF